VVPEDVELHNRITLTQLDELHGDTLLGRVLEVERAA